MKRLVYLLPILCLSRFGFQDLSQSHTTNIKIIYEGGAGVIQNGVDDARRILKDDKFYTRIGSEADFTYTAEHPKSISKWLKDAEVTVRVRTYKGGEDTRTLAYVTSKFPNTIFINADKVDRKRESIANTIIHEIIHTVDRKIEDARFGHGGNSAEGKKRSAPYFIGQLAENILTGNAVALINKQTIALDDISQFYNDGLRFVEETEDLNEDLIDK